MRRRHHHGRNGRRRVPGRVTFPTYHGAKGREFTLVVLPCLIDGIVPNYYDGQSPRALDAARQMFYVAVTRARQPDWSSGRPRRRSTEHRSHKRVDIMHAP
ncbi:3'-5' exonuclease [Embleya sp. NPDC005971]|uniref:3'-5' exonuclease n=1 Tax=Embleya sp. NPDC005971 TaxID=3156724 RepID=UPI0034040B8B